MKRIYALFGFSIASVSLALITNSTAFAATYTFPVLGQSSFSNDFSAPRGSERHNAIDVIAKKGQPIVSATDGKIINVMYPQPSWGYAVTILGRDNYCYWYLHLNNDNPGTDDGSGGAMRAYAENMKPGNPIRKGQLMGWAGDSGNAESTVPHLHFEVVKAESGRSNPCSFTNGPHINPYSNLVNAARISKPVTYPAMANELLPFRSGFKGGVSLAIGDSNNDGVQEYFVGAGEGGGPRVSIFNAAKKELLSFYAFSRSINKTYGLDVATGDVNGDGVEEIITSARTTAGSRVSIHKIDGSAAVKLGEFKVFNSSIASYVDAEDVNGDGKDEIIVSAGKGGGPRVNIYTSKGGLLESKYVYDESYKGGVDVAAGDITGDLGKEIVASPLITQPQLKVLDKNLAQMKELSPYGSSHKGGMRVSIGDVQKGSAKQEIVTVPAYGAPNIKHLNYDGRQLNQQRFFIEEWWRGYYDVAAGEVQDGHAVGMGVNRRTSVKY